MRQIAYIFTIMLFIACGQSNRSSIEKSASLQSDTLAQESIELSLDTLKVNGYLLIFENAAPFEETDIYGDL